MTEPYVDIVGVGGSNPPAPIRQPYGNLGFSDAPITTARGPIYQNRLETSLGYPARSGESQGMPIQRWCVSHRGDPAAAALADRHYNRQKPGTPQFAPTGSCAVFLTDCGRAFWITSAPLAEWVKHEWAGAWVCAAFRNEGAGKASELIRLAVAATRAHYGESPTLGIVTFIDRKKVRPTMVRGKPVWGWTYRKAGFFECGETKGGLLALQMLPAAMPEPMPAKPRSMHGTPLFDAMTHPTTPARHSGGGR